MSAKENLMLMLLEYGEKFHTTEKAFCTWIADRYPDGKFKFLRTECKDGELWAHNAPCCRFTFDIENNEDDIRYFTVQLEIFADNDSFGLIVHSVKEQGNVELKAYDKSGNDRYDRINFTKWNTSTLYIPNYFESGLNQILHLFPNTYDWEVSRYNTEQQELAIRKQEKANFKIALKKACWSTYGLTGTNDKLELIFKIASRSKTEEKILAAFGELLPLIK
jgi:hypothetical protein